MTCIIVPTTSRSCPTRSRRARTAPVISGRRLSRAAVVPGATSELRRAAEVLNAGEKVAMLVGQGADGAPTRSIEIADVLGAGVAKALNGRAALPDDLPFVTGSIGLLGTKPSDDMMEGCDTLLMVGSSFPYSEWLPEPGQARGVQIDIDARMLGIALPDRGRPGRRRRRDAARAAAAARAQGGPLVARGDRGRTSSAGGEILDGSAHQRRRPDQPAARLPRALAAAARPRDPHRRLGLGDELVGTPPAAAPRA